MRTCFGDCIGCAQPIRPPYLSFVVKLSKAPYGNSLLEWEDIDVCDACAAKLTAAELYRLVSAEEVEDAA